MRGQGELLAAFCFLFIMLNSVVIVESVVAVCDALESKIDLCIVGVWLLFRHVAREVQIALT
jgi:hypothetical protein